MESNFKTYQETAPFVEGLRSILQAENAVLEGFMGIYGEKIGEGEERFKESGLSDLFGEIKDSIKDWIGTTFELGLSGLLEAPGDPSLTAKREEV